MRPLISRNIGQMVVYELPIYTTVPIDIMPSPQARDTKELLQPPGLFVREVLKF